jgi:hypothetical protein
MDTVFDKKLENWVLSHADAGQKKLYFTINGDVPLRNNEGSAIVYQIPVSGKWVCVLHPDHLTRVAQICYAAGVQMVQILI